MKSRFLFSLFFFFSRNHVTDISVEENEGKNCVERLVQMQTGCKRDSLFCRTSRERPISSIKSFVKIDNRATLPNSACPSSPIRCPSWLPHTRRSSSSSSSWKRLFFLDESIALHESIFSRADQDFPTTTDKLRISRIIRT